MDYIAGGNRTDIAAEVWAWAVANGGNQLLRLAVCGYEDGREVPPGWEAVPWKANKGYQQTEAGRQNRHREMIWYSPHCVPALRINFFNILERA